ncbi:hypothetical protein BS47DRAFT_1354591 [Hydnum rufescens UP504]|uniref:Uncharacterized protein n=1 Tax=Hydnum rufescens UP504 TaxID=1448309 RepID=A0A9P6AFS8_9AGAM|nr:hypothetical protein BS47DRAFT_1354591 [Hydnum rufescens UP504]
MPYGTWARAWFSVFLVWGDEKRESKRRIRLCLRLGVLFISFLPKAANCATASFPSLPQLCLFSNSENEKLLKNRCGAT